MIESGDETRPDDELIELGRAGDDRALAQLWERHYARTVRIARRVIDDPHEAEDAASEAFSRMLAAIAGGGGPTGSVGGYLATTVRNRAINQSRRREAGNVVSSAPEDLLPETGPSDPVADRSELGLVREAFGALPWRWRVVLWRTAVEREANAVVAGELGLSANALASLAVRARAGLRLEYVRVHLSRGNVAVGCRPYVVLLPGLVSGRAASPALRVHLQDCARCRERVAELRDVERGLAAFVLPVALLTAAGHLGVLRRTPPGGPRPRGGALRSAASVAGAVVVVCACVAAGAPMTATAQAPAPRQLSAGTAETVVRDPRPEVRSTPRRPPAERPVPVPPAAPRRPIATAPSAATPAPPAASAVEGPDDEAASASTAGPCHPNRGINPHGCRPDGKGGRHATGTAVGPPDVRGTSGPARRPSAPGPASPAARMGASRAG